MRNGTAAALLSLLLFGCAVAPPGGAATPAHGLPGGAAASYPQRVAQLLAEANRVRVAANLQPLTAMPQLHRAAEEYARELAARGVLDHYSRTPGRETMTQRIEAAGATWRSAAENLFSFAGAGDDQLARHAISGWLGSPTHRVNLLGPQYTHTGVGIARDATGEWYVVQLYVLPRTGR